MYALIKSFLFMLSPEKAHYTTMWLLKTGLKIPGIASWLKGKPVNDPVELWGLHFPNKVGLGAGFDKNATFIDILAALGFGFIEVGTVTPRPQPGNPKPRLFRLPKNQALINRMGFNNDGVDAMVEKLRTRKNKKVIIGGNIGKNKDTPNENALDDYLVCFEKLYPWVDYFVVNVSSPNTPGLRELQEKEPLKKILNGVMHANRSKPALRPVLLKIAPDLTDTQLDDIIEIVKETGIDGLIATNTTISREGLNYHAAEIEKIGAGGLSGAPVKEKADRVIRYISTHSDIPMIGVGGITTPEDGLEKLYAGAKLVQLYTGFIYGGPPFIRNLAAMLCKYPRPNVKIDQ